MQLILIRHASNDWIGRRLAGWTPGIDLNEQGRCQAAQLAARLAGYPLEAVYSSPLERTVQTAGFIAAPHGLRVRIDPELGEVRCGSWEGEELSTLRADPLWQLLRDRPSSTPFPGGETILQVQSRAVAAIEQIRQEHAGPVAVVSHADVIQAVVAHYIGLPLDRFRSIRVRPASVSILRYDDLGVSLPLLGDTGHLPSWPRPDPPVRPHPPAPPAE